MRRALLILWPIALSPVASGQAQVCAGLPSLHERPSIVSADGSRASSGWSASAGVTAGRSLFGGAYVGTTRYQDVPFAAQTGDASSTVAGGGVGYDVALVADQEHGGARLALCPLLTGEWESGPDADFGGTKLDSDGWTVGAGISAGGVLLRNARWRLLPTASASFVRVSSTVHDFPFVGTDSKTRDDGWVLAFGLGVGIGPRVTVMPGMNVPVAIEGGENSFTLSVNVGFGH